MLQHEKFDAYRHALELLEHIRQVAVDALPKGSRALGQRIIAAGSSLVVEIASAVAQPSTGGKRRAFRLAILAATKCAAIIDVLRKLALIGEKEHLKAKEIVERIVRALARRVRAQETNQTKPATVSREAPREVPAPREASSGVPSGETPDEVPLVLNETTSGESTSAEDATNSPAEELSAVRHAAQLLRRRGQRTGTSLPVLHP